MNHELQRADNEPVAIRKNLRTPVKRPQNLLSIDIAMIRSAGFYRNLKDKDNTLFSTSLYEIDQIIREKLEQEREPEETDEQLVERLLPKEY
jgi:hypothetical protein